MPTLCWCGPSAAGFDAILAEHGGAADRVTAWTWRGLRCRRLDLGPSAAREPDATGRGGAPDGPAALDALAERVRLAAAAEGAAVSVLADDLAALGPGLIVSDVDSTLITEEVIELLADAAGRRPEVAAATERAMRGELDFAESLATRVAALEGLDESAIDGVIDRVELSPGAAALVATAREREVAFALVSGGFHEVVDPIAAALGVDLVRANQLAIADGRLNGRTLGPVVDRAAKARHLVAFAADLGLDLGRVVAVGDGANDLDMLERAGLGIAYLAKPAAAQRADCVLDFARLDAVAVLSGLVAG